MTTSDVDLKSVLRCVDRQFDEFKRILVELSRIPSVSAPGSLAWRSAGPPGLRRPAAAGRHAERPHPRDPGRPSLRLRRLARPTGKADARALRPSRRRAAGTRRSSGCRRPSSRSSARGGSTAAARPTTRAESWSTSQRSLPTCGPPASLPCNVKFVIEGEEEIGSENLASFLRKYKGLMAADAVVLSDTSNFDTGVPGLTYRLRGMCQVDVEVRCLERPVHSGQRGGAVPDPVQILSRLIADLTAADGSLDIPGLYRRVEKTTARRRARIRRLPFDEAQYAKSSGLLKGVRLAGERGYSVYERIWTRPSLTVIAFESHPDPRVLEPDRRLRPRPDLHADGSEHGLARGGGVAGAQADEEAAVRSARRGAGRAQHAVVEDGSGRSGLRRGAARAQGRLRKGRRDDGRRAAPSASSSRSRTS